MSSQLGEFFKTTADVCQRCLPSPVMFEVFLEKIVQKTLHDNQTSTSIGGRPICNLRFADDIALMDSYNGELQDFTKRLVDRAPANETEVSTEKSKITTNSTNNVSAYISMIGQKLEEVTSLKYLGTTQCKDVTCSADVRIGIASAIVAMARLNRM